jgi:hypothetical protein
MKWVKMKQIPFAKTHQAGYKFWDLLTDDQDCLGWIRFVPKLGYQYFPSDRNEEAHFKDIHTTLKSAKHAVVAYYVTQKLEQASER